VPTVVRRIGRLTELPLIIQSVEKGNPMTGTRNRQYFIAALKWELCWTPFEMACVGIGLWMMLSLQWMTLGTLWLVAFVAIDLGIRIRHYSLVAPEIEGSQINF
jgi:hypothetical protein